MGAKWFGASVKRKEDPALLTGQGRYVDDIHVPGLLEVAVLRSPHPHAGIRGIDTARALALPKKEFMQRAEALWAELKLPPITLKAPWHGYTLGDWIERWDVWADRAVKGTWEETGRETLARQRGGVKPESSARKVEE